MDVERFETAFEPDDAALIGLRAKLRRWLAAQAISRVEAERVVLAVHEAAANAVENAVPGEPVVVKATRDGSELAVVVTNSGRWREPQYRDGRGRGLTLMEALTTALEIRREADETVVRMRMHV